MGPTWNATGSNCGWVSIGEQPPPGAAAAC